MSGAEELPTLRALTEAGARVSRRDRQYKIGGIGRAAIAKFLETGYTFTVSDMGPNDRVTLTVRASGDIDPNGVVHVDLPAGWLEEVS